ncbi:MAG: hypothetical protein L3J67_03155 [Hyphomicrobiaceae bacterium]|nr:hypothetical protein [Hyphomicrobiaceae bacterium]
MTTRAIVQNMPHQSLLAIATLMLISLCTFSSMARADSADVVNSLPAQIPEIVTGGSWKNGNLGGVYRAVVVLSKADHKKTGLLSKANAGAPATAAKPILHERKAEVFIQWIAYENGKATSKIIKTVSIKEFNEKQLRHAFLAMDTLKDNEMTLLVTSYDENKDKDVSVSVKATTPGIYEHSKKAQ